MIAAKELLNQGIQILKEAGIEASENDARLLFEHTCHMTRSDLLLHPTKEVEEKEFLSLIEERKRHIPLQHIMGYTYFMGFPFYVSSDVLVPRNDTEILVELALREMQEGDRVLDVCTGSGCILISLLLMKSRVNGEGVDLSTMALQMAEKNAAQFDELKDRIHFTHSDLFENVAGEYDVIVSNPPYIATKEIDTLSEEVRDHDPRMALDGGEDGLVFYREIARTAPRYLKEDGCILLEIGYDQGEAVSVLLKENGFSQVTVHKDYAGLDRVVKGYKRG